MTQILRPTKNLMFFWDRPLLFLFSTSLLHLLFAFQHPHSLFSKICSPLSLVINNSLVENFELVISNDDNNSPKESKCFQWWWHHQQTCPKLTSLSSARQIYHWPAHNSVNPEFAYTILLIPPIQEYSSVWEMQCSVSTGDNSPMNRPPISNSTYVQIPCVNYIPPLHRIWPGFIQKSSLFHQQSLGMTQTHVPIFFKSLYSLDDKIRTTVQPITCTVLQNFLSLFTAIHNPHPNIISHMSNQAQQSSPDLLVEGHHLSKIRLGTNVRYQTSYTYRKLSICLYIYLL